MSAPVRGNKASKLRSEEKVEKPAFIGPSWALTSTRGRAFNRGSEPTSRDTSRIPTILRPRSIPTSRIPIRRLAGDPKRNTSPIRATPLEAVTSAITSASACSLPLLLASENTVGDHERKPEVDKDSVKRTKCLPRPRAKSTTEAVLQPSSRNEKSHHRVNELNKVRGLEMQHKKLENLQSKFMHKIRILAPQKLQGVYKSVAVVVNEKCKVVVHADDLHRLPKNLLDTEEQG
ncbi:uncharacterized protein LOC128265631 isoform X3 [Drosophila gunungcola]|uniref:uncharacterized protein LOC128265631 isoform X3 n=1 Tax=Drosophila gunungcola TaxID=103775 RepID=UPI0022E92318|nr:uncharacterized protein LOC128265631 isoform X3 [Drosophila gunungcola]